MSETREPSQQEQRRSSRVGLDGAVTIRFVTDAIVGSGQNGSALGVFFTTDARLPVTVEIEGRDGALRGELVRVESLGPGQLGIAVKFDAPDDDLVGGP